MKVRCARCGMTANPDPIYIWHAKDFVGESGSGDEIKETLWLCPECCADIPGAKARDRFLERQWRDGRNA